MSHPHVLATIDATPATSRSSLRAVPAQLGAISKLFRLEGSLGLFTSLSKGALPTRTPRRIAVRFAYEWHDDSLRFGSCGSKNWEFDEHGLMRQRTASVNDGPRKEAKRKFFWPLGRRADDHASLSDLGL